MATAFFEHGKNVLATLRRFKAENFEDPAARDEAGKVIPWIQSIKDRLMFAVNLDTAPLDLVELIDEFIENLLALDHCRGYSMEATPACYNGQGFRGNQPITPISRNYQESADRAVKRYLKNREHDVSRNMQRVAASAYSLMRAAPELCKADPVLSFLIDEVVFSVEDYASLVYSRYSRSNPEWISIRCTSPVEIGIQNFSAGLRPVVFHKPGVNSQVSVKFNIQTTSPNNIDHTCMLGHMAMQPCSLSSLTEEHLAMFDKIEKFVDDVYRDCTFLPKGFWDKWLSAERLRIAKQSDKLKADQQQFERDAQKQRANFQRQLNELAQIDERLRAIHSS